MHKGGSEPLGLQGEFLIIHTGRNIYQQHKLQFDTMAILPLRRLDPSGQKPRLLEKGMPDRPAKRLVCTECCPNPNLQEIAAIAFTQIAEAHSNNTRSYLGA